MDKDALTKTMQDKYSENRITDGEKQILSATFKDNLELVKVLRKIFLPELDAKNPLHMNIDLWMQDDYQNMTADEVKIAVLARTKLIKHVEACLFTLLTLSESEMTPAELAEKRKKDSTR